MQYREFAFEIKEIQVTNRLFESVSHDATSESSKIDGNNEATPSMKKVIQAELNGQVDLSNLNNFGISSN